MLNAIAHIRHIRSAEAAHALSQNDSLGWIMRALARERDALGEPAARAMNLYERLLSQEMIKTRRSVLADYTHNDWDKMELYRAWPRELQPDAPWFAPPLQQRMRIFGHEAGQLVDELFLDQESAPQTIVEVSCTGYQAPYTAQTLSLRKGWESQTQLIKLGHMGCYAAVPGLHLAARMVRDDSSISSMVNVELCTLHLNPIACAPESLVSNILFADGASRIDLTREGQKGDLALLAHEERMIPGTAEFMSWDLHDSRFHMTLSRKVVIELGRIIAEACDAFLAAQGLLRSDMAAYAIHPGGPRIIETVQEKLGLSDKSTEASRAVLRDYGNMSSATLPHIWQKLMKDPDLKSGDLILSMAFGPGLTLAMNLMQKV